MAVLKFNRTLDENYMYITVSNEELFFKYYEAIKYGRGVGGGVKSIIKSYGLYWIYKVIKYDRSD